MHSIQLIYNCGCFLHQRTTDESLGSGVANEDQLQELRLKYNGLCSIIATADHFFRHPIGMVLVIELIRLCVHIYTMIALPLCERENDYYILKNVLLITAVLIPSARLNHRVSIAIF